MCQSKTFFLQMHTIMCQYVEFCRVSHNSVEILEMVKIFSFQHSLTSTFLLGVWPITKL